jgi:hypothetical protein
MRLLPPVTDREGNVYVAYGSSETTDSSVWVGHVDGDWSGPCSAHRGSSVGIHGFVGRDDTRSWLWSGEGLYELRGDNGACAEVLSTDPVTGTSLTFLGVVPGVIDRPSQTAISALVIGAEDPLPFHVSLDLNRSNWLSISNFEPSDSENVHVLGTGFAGKEEGLFLVQYTQGGATVVEAIHVDDDGIPQKRTPVAWSDGEEVSGFLVRSDSGLWAGVTHTGGLVLIGAAGGEIRTGVGMTVTGVHVQDGDLWAVGALEGVAHIAEVLSDGALGGIVQWDSAIALKAELAEGITVLDQRSGSWLDSDWMGVQSAISGNVLTSAHPLDAYADGATGWLVAGPSYDATTEPITSVAFAPAGFSLP